MTQNDYQLAILLQKQFEHEASIDIPTNNLTYSKKKSVNEKSLVDPSWELIDPTPNIYILFVAFNEKYFWNKLQAVSVEWSKRMTACAGICSYNGRGGLCKISLSEPLLKLRPRKDLVETLLHEMIHAYLFVTANNKDRDGHGPEFHKHMYRINADAGTNITVYHDFIDEVRLYQQHWWRCNGPCQFKKPYFGMVRRATNRAPGPNDRWWDDHLKNCNGTFIKVKEPEKPIKKSGKPTKVEPTNTLNKYFPVLNDNTNKCSNKLLNSNIVSFNDLKGKTSTSTATRSNSNSTIVATKQPTQLPTNSFMVSKSIPVATTTSNRVKNDSDYARVRNHWINKYSNNNEVSNKRSKPFDDKESNNVTPEKRHKPDDTNLVDCPICQKRFNTEDINTHLDLCLEQPIQMSRCSTCQQNIPNCDLEEHIGNCTDRQHNNNDFSELIPCLVCGKKVLKVNLNIHLDECMGDDIFTVDDSHGDTVIDNKPDEVDKKYNCPVCTQAFFVHEMSDHLTLCLVNEDLFCNVW